MRRHLTITLAAIALSVAPLAAGCSSETKDKAGDAIESGKDDAAKTADEVEARTTAEALRASLKGNDTADEDGIRSVAAINEAVEDLPGDPEVTGIDDTDGDGLDDDGKVQVTVDESQSCLTLPAEGEDADVEDGAC